MKNNHIISLMQEGFTTVNVTFQIDEDLYNKTVDKSYTYKTNLKLEKGDLVIVDAPNGFKFVRVVEVHEEPEIDVDAPYEYKWIIDKVDLSNYEEILKSEKEAATQLRKMKAKAIRSKALETFKQEFGEEMPKLEIKKRI